MYMCMTHCLIDTQLQTIGMTRPSYVGRLSHVMARAETFPQHEVTHEITLKKRSILCLSLNKLAPLHCTGELY